VESSGPNETARRVFFVPVSGKEAQERLRLSLTRPISIDIAGVISSELAADAMDHGALYAWGAKPEPRNDKTWARMRPGDIVIFYAQGLYSLIATVKATLQSPALGEALWGAGEDGTRWELTYFLTRPLRIDIPLDSLSDVFQSAPYQGFVELTEVRSATIESQYGSIQDFVSQRLLNQGATPPNFFIFRSNPDSDWDDDGASVYHYGRTVPNYTKLRIGTAAVFDRKQNGTVILYGYGRITDIRERDDGTFDAMVDNKAIEPRPYTDEELALLRAQPGYNVQHAIRPISSDLYDQLTGAKVNGQSALLEEDFPESISSQLSWTLERAIQLQNLLRRTASLLIAGPPGTGKTFLAKAISEALTAEEAQRGMVQFHPAYQYEDFIEGIRPVLSGNTLSYEMHRGVLLSIAGRATANPDLKYVLILDELNRGNVARIFGELIYSIEYRGQENTLTLASGETFFLPKNLLIIATMNTADRSITGLDTALRRRFKQLYLGPDYAALETYLIKVLGADVAQQTKARLERLNTELMGIHGDAGKLVGHTYFMQTSMDQNDIVQLWNEQLEPLITEYLFDRAEEVVRLKALFMG
jgi:hypothetical protein